MTLQHKLLKDLTESDLQELIDNKIREDKQWDYKRQQIGKTEGEKKEFLQDVCSFANATGGHMILGVDEGEGVERGLPVKLVGFTVNVDEEISRLQNILLNGIEPRIYGLDMKAVELSSQQERVGTVAIVIRIPQSISVPHMVKFQGHHTFYSRTSNGKYPLEVNELRNLFGLSNSAIEGIRNFHGILIAWKIGANQFPKVMRMTFYYKMAKLVNYYVVYDIFSPK